MKEQTARTVANVVMGAAAIGAAVVILRTPALRRVAFGLARTALVTMIPAWLTSEVKGAWRASDTRVDLSDDTPEGVAPQPPGDGFPAPSPVHEDPARPRTEDFDVPGASRNPA